MPMPKHSGSIRVSEEVRITLERVNSNSDESEGGGKCWACPACSQMYHHGVLRIKREIPKETHFWGCLGYPGLTATLICDY